MRYDEICLKVNFIVPKAPRRGFKLRAFRKVEIPKHVRKKAALIFAN